MMSHNMTSNWGMSQAKQSTDRCSWDASQEKIQLPQVGLWLQLILLQPSWKICLLHPLLCTPTYSVGNKQEELEMCVWSVGHDPIAITEPWWNTHVAAMLPWMVTYLFRKATPARGSGGVALHVREQLEFIEVCLGKDKKLIHKD